MENEKEEVKKDDLIKEELKKDEFISKKANDFFENLIKGDNIMDMNNKIEKKINQEVKQDDNSKKKMKKSTKILSLVATLVIVFGLSNVYATTKGYDNIFFMIKYLITGEDNSKDRKQIFSDEDITISFESIDITNNIQLQVKKLQKKDNEAKLILAVNEKNLETDKEIVPLKYKVYNKENMNLYKEQTSSKATSMELVQYTEELKLNNFENNTKVLRLEIYKANDDALSTIDIDLENKSIEVLGKKEALEKISETELKEYLGIFSTYLMYDKEKEVLKIETEEKNQMKLLSIYQMLYYLGKEEQYMKDTQVGSGIEFSDADFMTQNMLGTKIENFKNTNSYFVKTTKNGKSYYAVNGGFDFGAGNCINITDISYVEGIYNVTYTYCYIDDALLFDMTQGSYDIFENTIGLKLNEDTSFSKYQLVSYDNPRYIQETNKNTEKTENDEKTENKNEVKKTLQPEGFSGSSLTRILLYSDGRALFVTYNGEGISDKNIVSTKLIARNVEDIEKDGEGENFKTINLKGDNIDINDSSYSWITFNNVNKKTDGSTDANQKDTTNKDVNNYASTMSWTNCYAPGITIQYPKEFELKELGGYYRGGRQGEISTTISGLARGINPDTKEIIDSDLTINIYEPFFVNSYEGIREFIYDKNGMEYGYLTTKTGIKWHYSTDSKMAHIEQMNDGTYWVYKIEFSTNRRDNYKVTNIINWMLGSTKITSY